MSHTFDDRLSEACEWSAALEGEDTDWEAFATWLEVDPANVEAYEAVAAIEADISRVAPLLRTILPADEEPRCMRLQSLGELR